MRVHPGTAGAEVHGGQSYKRIETIVAGDRVLAWSETTGALSWKPVQQTFVRTTGAIYKLTYDDGTVVETTWNHPFYLEGRGWVEAKDLTPADVSATAGSLADNHRLLALAADGAHGGMTYAGMVSGRDVPRGPAAALVSTRKTERPGVTVYNFEVAEAHTYFVTKAQVLVHNASGYSSPVAQSDLGKRVTDKLNDGSFNYDRFGNATVNSGTFAFLSNFGEGAVNLLGGYGFNSNAEVSLAAITAPSAGAPAGDITVNFPDSSSMTRLGASSWGSPMVEMQFADGHSALMQDNRALARLVDGAGLTGPGYGGINSAAGLNGFLSGNLGSYYQKFGQTCAGERCIGAGNAVGDPPHAYGGALFKYANTGQPVLGDPVPPEVAARYPYGKYGILDLNDVLFCRPSVQVDMLKSKGLLRPDVTMYELDDPQKPDNLGISRVDWSTYPWAKDNPILNAAASSDWAKLTGADRNSYAWTRVGSDTAAPGAVTALNRGETLYVGNSEHVWANYRDQTKPGRPRMDADPLYPMPTKAPLRKIEYVYKLDVAKGAGQ